MLRIPTPSPQGKSAGFPYFKGHFHQHHSKPLDFLGPLDLNVDHGHLTRKKPSHNLPQMALASSTDLRSLKETKALRQFTPPTCDEFFWGNFWRRKFSSASHLSPHHSRDFRFEHHRLKQLTIGDEKKHKYPRNTRLIYGFPIGVCW